MTSTDGGARGLRPRKPPQGDLDTGPPPAAGDAALVAASLQEPELFSLVYERHANAMYRFAYRRLGPDLAQDAVSDAILEAVCSPIRAYPMFTMNPELAPRT
jgi:hypothetical protein